MAAPRDEIEALLRWTAPIAVAAPITTSAVADATFTRKLVTYVAPDGDEVSSFLFEPATTPRAAVIVLHQHNSDWSLGKSEVAGLAGDPLQAFGPALAHAGFLVLAPDALGFESRRGVAPEHAAPTPPPLPRGTRTSDWVQYYNHAMHRLVRGELLLTKLLGDIAAAVSTVRTLAPSLSIGVVGHSFGGNLALFAAALDTRLSFAAVSGALCSFRYKLAHGIPLEMALVIPGLAGRFDVDDLVRCVAPRRLLVVSAADDAYSADAEAVVTSGRTAFDASGASAALTHVRVPGPHALDQARFDLIVEWLRAQGGAMRVDADTVAGLRPETPFDRERLIGEYIAYGTARSGEENWGWASECMFSLLEKRPELAWSLILEMIERAPSDAALGFIAASPLEDLLSDHGHQFIARVESRAVESNQFRRALGMLRRLGMTEDVWRRVQVAAR